MSKRPPTAVAVEFNNIVIELDNLTKRRVTWQDGLQRVAIRELYEILGECFALYGRLIASNALKSKLSKELRQRNVTQTAGTSLQLKVIRYVFGECDQEHVYAKAIKVAHDQKPENVSFTDWLADQGGPAGVKAKSSKKEKDTAALIETATHHFEHVPALSLLSTDDLLPNPNANHNYAVALVRIDPSDPAKREIVFGTSNVAATNFVLELAGKTLPPEALKLRKLDDPNLDLQPITLEAAE